MTAELGVGLATFLPGYGINAQNPPGPELLEEALEAGVRYFDTAPVYGSGDHALGKVVRATGLAHEVRICTKVAVAQVESADDLIAGVHRSVERLGFDRVHAVLAHSATSIALQSDYIAEGMLAIRAANLCDLAGASTYGVDDATTATAQRWCDVVQVEHSVLNPAVVQAIVHTRRHDQWIVGRSALAKGLLTPRRSASGAIANSLIETLNALEECANDWGFSLPELAIRFALDTHGVNVVVVGVSSNEELGTALSASRRPPLTSTQLETLKRFDRSADDAAHPERWPQENRV